jgi:hypothetical protein
VHAAVESHRHPREATREIEEKDYQSRADKWRPIERVLQAALHLELGDAEILILDAVPAPLEDLDNKQILVLEGPTDPHLRGGAAREGDDLQVEDSISGERDHRAEQVMLLLIFLALGMIRRMKDQRFMRKQSGVI